MTTIFFMINFIQKNLALKLSLEWTTTAAPFKFKLPKIKRPNIPRVHQREDDNKTDSNSTTTITPDGNIAQQDSVVVTLSIGKILYMNKIKIEVKKFLFF